MASSTAFGIWLSSKNVPSFEFRNWYGENDGVFTHGDDGGEGGLDST